MTMGYVQGKAWISCSPLRRKQIVHVAQHCDLQVLARYVRECCSHTLPAMNRCHCTKGTCRVLCYEHLTHCQKTPRMLQPYSLRTCPSALNATPHAQRCSGATGSLRKAESTSACNTIQILTQCILANSTEYLTFKRPGTLPSFSSCRRIARAKASSVS